VLQDACGPISLLLDKQNCRPLSEGSKHLVHHISTHKLFKINYTVLLAKTSLSESARPRSVSMGVDSLICEVSAVACREQGTAGAHSMLHFKPSG